MLKWKNRGENIISYTQQGSLSVRSDWAECIPHDILYLCQHLIYDQLSWVWPQRSGSVLISVFISSPENTAQWEDVNWTLKGQHIKRRLPFDDMIVRDGFIMLFIFYGCFVDYSVAGVCSDVLFWPSFLILKTQTFCFWSFWFTRDFKICKNAGPNLFHKKSNLFKFGMTHLVGLCGGVVFHHRHTGEEQEYQSVRPGSCSVWSFLCTLLDYLHTLAFTHLVLLVPENSSSPVFLEKSVPHMV